MNNPMLYPFLAVCGVFVLAFGVWCYFTLRDQKLAKRIVEAVVLHRYRDYQRKLVQASRDMAESIIADDAAPEISHHDREQGQPSYGKLYRHHGHRHAKRPPNRADRRSAS